MAEGCRYDEAGPWLGGRTCAGKFYSGTEALAESIKRKYGGSYGGYACRQNTADSSQLSVHGTGRAVDFFPQSKSEGDAIAGWLVQNHKKFGIQLVIWYRRDWDCDSGWTSYGGPVPHTDHLHIELTVPASRNNTAATYMIGALFTVGQYENIQGNVTRQGRMTRETVVTQARMTREFVSNLFDKASKEGRAVSSREITLIREKVERESDQIIAAIDASDPDTPVPDSLATPEAQT
ncbi:MAG: hypothetical protein ABWY25_10955 [Paenisporosarcina sp.]